MSKYELKIADKDEGFVPLALGMTQERSQQISRSVTEETDNEETTLVVLLERLVEKCETLEEVVAMAFCLGGFHERQTTEADMLAEALEHTMMNLKDKPQA